MQSCYKCEDGFRIGFTHREDVNKADLDYPQNYHIGFSISRDGGQHWKYRGDACGTCHNYTSKNRADSVWPNICDAAYCSALDKYLLLVQTARQIVMFLSDDCVNWGEHMVLSTANPDKDLFLLHHRRSGRRGFGRFLRVFHAQDRLPSHFGDYDTGVFCRCRVTIDK